MNKISILLAMIVIMAAVVFLKKTKYMSSTQTSDKAEIVLRNSENDKQNISNEKTNQAGVQASGQSIAQSEEKPTCKTTFFKVERSKISSNHNTWTMNNQFVLQDQGFNPKSICVRLKNTPIPFHYDSKERKITVSSVSKNEDTISVTYCFAGNTCKENCVIPKDEFMMALDGSDGTTLSDNDAGSADEQELSKEDTALNQELKAFDLDALDPKKSDRAIFADWNISSVMKQCSGSAKVSAR